VAGGSYFSFALRSNTAMGLEEVVEVRKGNANAKPKTTESSFKMMRRHCPCSYLVGKGGSNENPRMMRVVFYSGIVFIECSFVNIP
jgi:hypothetical protein